MGWRTALLTTLLAMSAACGDERWEGDVEDCSGNVSDFKAVLMMDGPVTPSPTGWFGTADNSADDTWTLTRLKDSNHLGPTLSFEATFDSGGFQQRWKVELEKKAPNRYEGDATIDVDVPLLGTSTTKCDMVLEPK